MEEIQTRPEPPLQYFIAHVSDYVVVTSDHATPVSVKEHTGEPVPVMLYGPDVVVDDVSKFSEVTCWRGSLGRIRGIDIMPTLGSYLGLLKNSASNAARGAHRHCAESKRRGL
jgi:2,3-bisphosphoglycerate-independent phosphoglycerate mutase